MFKINPFSFVAAFALLAAGFAQDAAANPPIQHGRDFCAASTLNVCGALLAVNSSQPAGIINVQMPEQFVVRSMMVQCVVGPNGAYYTILQPSANMCELKKCKAGSQVNVCGDVLDVAKEAHIGEVVKIQVPKEKLALSKKHITATFTARCNLHDGGAEYDVLNTAGLSCNDFGCEPESLKVCGEVVNVREPGELGDRIDVLTNNKNKVKVECLASGGKRPAYVVIDRDGGVCD